MSNSRYSRRAPSHSRPATPKQKSPKQTTPILQLHVTGDIDLQRSRSTEIGASNSKECTSHALSQWEQFQQTQNMTSLVNDIAQNCSSSRSQQVGDTSVVHISETAQLSSLFDFLNTCAQSSESSDATQTRWALDVLKALTSAHDSEKVEAYSSDKYDRFKDNKKNNAFSSSSAAAKGPKVQIKGGSTVSQFQQDFGNSNEASEDSASNAASQDNAASEDSATDSNTLSGNGTASFSNEATGDAAKAKGSNESILVEEYLNENGGSKDTEDISIVFENSLDAHIFDLLLGRLRQKQDLKAQSSGKTSAQSHSSLSEAEVDSLNRAHWVTDGKIYNSAQVNSGLIKTTSQNVTDSHALTHLNESADKVNSFMSLDRDANSNINLKYDLKLDSGIPPSDEHHCDETGAGAHGSVSKANDVLKLYTTFLDDLQKAAESNQKPRNTDSTSASPTNPTNILSDYLHAIHHMNQECCAATLSSCNGCTCTQETSNACCTNKQSPIHPYDYPKIKLPEPHFPKCANKLTEPTTHITDEVDVKIEPVDLNVPEDTSLCATPEHPHCNPDAGEDEMSIDVHLTDVVTDSDVKSGGRRRSGGRRESDNSP